MSKLKKIISRLTESSKLNAIVSLISLVACIIMIVILGVVSVICTTLENICQGKLRDKTKRG